MAMLQPVQGLGTASATLAQEEDAPQVLTLGEAAALLRLPKAEVARLAQSGELPGRRIGKSWRFSRVLLLAWLGGERTPSAEVLRELGEAELERLATRLKAGNDLLAPGDLQNTRGQGTAPPGGNTLLRSAQAEAPNSHLPAQPGQSEEPPSQAQPVRPPGGPGESPPAPIGEKPDLGTAREVFLQQEGLLIGRQKLTLEVDPSYSKFEDTGVVPFAFVTVPEKLTVRSFQTNFMARYGLANRLQLSAGVPLVHAWTNTSIPGASTGRQQTVWGDVNLAARLSALREGPSNPEIVVSLAGAIPTQSGSGYGAGGGIAVLRSVDPVSLFGSVDYLHSFTDVPTNVPRFHAKELVNAIAGLAIALNDTISINGEVIGRFADRPSFANVLLSSHDRYILQLGVTSLLTEHLYIGPTVGFDMGGPSNVIIGVTIPYTF